MDEKTITYFDAYTPEFDAWRLKFALSVLNKHCGNDSYLVDIGCGTGNLLEVILMQTPIRNIYGIDVSKNNLSIVRNRINCETLSGSILDDNFINSIEQQFDFAILGAVLHHLVGRTRNNSRQNALKAVLNALRLLKKDGLLIILEPVFSPSIIMAMLFYVKRFFSKIINKRIQILGAWNNIGAPVVSYFTDKQIIQMLRIMKNAEIVDIDQKILSLNLLWKLSGITNRADMTIILKKIN